MLVAEDVRREYGESRYERRIAGRCDFMKTQQKNKPAVITHTIGADNQATSQTDWHWMAFLGAVGCTLAQ